MKELEEQTQEAKLENLPVYVGTKIIQATPMDFETWSKSQNKWQDGQETMGDGYMVIYDDGYRSWSPKNVFERCYRPLTDREKALM